MILHDFVHQWDGKSQSGERPITWWPGAYRVRIIQLDDPDAGVHYLFPRAVVFSAIPMEGSLNTHLKNHIDNFAREMARAFNLNIEKTLWVEWGTPPMVAILKPSGFLGDKTFYAISWRPPRRLELDQIIPYLKEDT